MPKRDILPQTAADETYLIILAGLMSSTGGVMKPPKTVYLSGSFPNWRIISEKKTGVMTGMVISKNATPGSRKHEHPWMYKYCPHSVDEETLGRHFRSHFNETIASELFRYVLGESAPKNRLTKNEGEFPGMVSRFLPEFRSFQDVAESMREEEKIAQLRRLDDQSGLADALVVSAFFNDHDARFENIGLFHSAEGREKVGRIDFGTAFAQINHPLFCLGMYLFGQGNFDPRLKKYADRYGWLLKTPVLQASLKKIAALNIAHIRIILEIAIQRWIMAWSDTPLSGLAIQKLFKHIWGEDRELWRLHGYMEQSTVKIDFTLFKQKMIETMMASFERRKSLFSYFAQLLSILNADVFSPEAFEHLTHEHQHDADKSCLLSWISDSPYFRALPLFSTGCRQPRLSFGC